MQAGLLQLAGTSNGFPPQIDTGVFALDADSSAEIGTAGTATGKGTLTVDAGTALIGSGLNVEAIAPTIVDNGLIEVIDPTYLSISDLDVFATIVGSGSISVGATHSLFITGSVTGLSAIAEGTASALSITGSFTSSIAWATGVQASNYVGGTLGGLARLEVGSGGGLEVGGAVSNLGAIKVDTGASAKFDATVSGRSSLEIDGGAVATIEGAVLGLTGMDLAKSASLALFGNDAAAPISLAGSDVLAIGAGITMGGTLSGFNVSDLLQAVSLGFTNGGTPITAATITGSGATQTLVLSDDGATISTIRIAGNYPGQPFLTDSVGLADGYSDVTLPGTIVTGIGAGGTITGESGSLFKVIRGSGAVASLSFIGNAALEGVFSAGTVTIGGTLANALNVTDIEANAALTATGTAAIRTGLEVDGAAASFIDRGGLTVGGGPPSAQLYVLNGGSVQAADIALTGDDSGLLTNGATFLVDAAGTAEIGGGAIAGAGTIGIAPGATLSAAGLNITVAAPAIVDDGVISVQPPVYAETFVSSMDIDSDISGTGTIQVASNWSLLINGNVTGLAAIDTGTGSSLLVLGDMTNPGTLTTGVTSTTTIEGAISGLAAINEGARAALELKGTVSGSGTISIGNGGHATIDSTVLGLRAIRVGGGATLLITGSDANVPIVMAPASTLEIGPDTPVGGTISGFARGDVIEVLLANLGTIVTAATFTAGPGNTGTLVLSDDGETLDTLHLAGNFAGQQFLTNAAGAGGVTDITLAPVPVPGTLAQHAV
jgi:hypothetical protein